MTSIASLSHVVGQGPVRVIAHHGWFGSAEAWQPLARLLDPDRFTVAYLDNRGYGARKDAPGDHTLDEIAADTLELADALGWSRFHLMGHSMGGKSIVRTAIDAPDRVGRLLGITPVPACPIPFDEPTWALFSGAAASLEKRRAIVDHSTGGRLSKHWVASIADHSWRESKPEAFAGYLNAWAKSDFVAGASRIDLPIHVVVGEHDPSLDRALMEATTLRWFPRATLEVIPNAGHYPMDETPVALATIVEKVFAEPA